VIRLGHWSYQRTIVMAHVLILTDRELIIIRDDPDSPRSFDMTRYGGVWDYIPLERIERIACRKKDANMLSLAIELPLGDSGGEPLRGESHAEVERFLNHLIEWAPEAVLQRSSP